jgi:hypothetical protein
LASGKQAGNKLVLASGEVRLGHECTRGSPGSVVQVPTIFLSTHKFHPRIRVRSGSLNYLQVIVSTSSGTVALVCWWAQLPCLATPIHGVAKKGQHSTPCTLTVTVKGKLVSERTRGFTTILFHGPDGESKATAFQRIVFLSLISTRSPFHSPQKEPSPCLIMI